MKEKENKIERILVEDDAELVAVRTKNHHKYKDFKKLSRLWNIDEGVCRA